MRASLYRRLLEEAGFTIQSIDLIPRPTPLPNGMESWLNTFRNGVLDQLNPPAHPENARATAVANTVALLEPILRDADGNWTADYVRLRFDARKKQYTPIVPRNARTPRNTCNAVTPKRRRSMGQECLS